MNIDVEQRIKELQKDSKFFFKQTEEIIDIVYRLAIQDCNCEIPPKNFTNEITKEINDKITDKVIFNTKVIDEKHDFKRELADALNVIKEQDEKIKKLNSQIHDLERNNKKSLPKKATELEYSYKKDNSFQSGMVSGLKYSIMALEGHNFEEAWGLITKKYCEVNKPSKEYLP